VPISTSCWIVLCDHNPRTLQTDDLTRARRVRMFRRQDVSQTDVTLTMSARMSVSWNAVFIQLYVSAKRPHPEQASACMAHLSVGCRGVPRGCLRRRAGHAAADGRVLVAAGRHQCSRQTASDRPPRTRSSRRPTAATVVRARTTTGTGLYTHVQPTQKHSWPLSTSPIAAHE